MTPATKACPEASTGVCIDGGECGAVMVPEALYRPGGARSRRSRCGRRVEVGHLEGDLIIGATASHSAIAAVFDRTSRYLWMTGLPDGHTAPQTQDDMTGLLDRIPPALRRTLTWDQGGEMALHDTLADRCGIEI